MLLDAGETRQGFAWFNKAASQGHLMGLNMVGRCYDQGWGTAIDKVRAAECFRVAAERGLDWGMFNHARMLLEAARTDEARRWIAEARKTATPAFTAKMRGWILGSRWPELAEALAC